MGQSLRSRLQRIRDPSGPPLRAPSGPPLRAPSGPPSRTENSGSVPGPDWAAVGFKAAKRSVSLDLPVPLILPFPRALSVLIPDLLRYAGSGVPEPGDLVFFDLETTGLSGGAGTVAFLAAFGRFTPIRDQRDAAGPARPPKAAGAPPGFRLQIDQYLLLDYPGEYDFLGALLPEFRKTGGPPLAVTYNGKSFDSQILRTRCLMNGIAPPVYYHADLLHPARRLWRRVLPSCSQGEIETAVLGLDRTADVPGALAPDIWFSFLRSGDGGTLSGICDHNVRDILGLASLFSALGHIAGNPLETGKAYRADMASLALRWREAARGGPAREKGTGPGLRETAEELLAAAGKDHPEVTYIQGLDLIRDGSLREGRRRLRSLLGGTIPPRVRAAAYRTLAVDAEWRLRDLKAALDYVGAALDLDVIGEGLKTEFRRRRDRLNQKAARQGRGIR